MARALGLSASELSGALRPATERDLTQVRLFRRALTSRHPAWDDDAYLRWRYRLGRATMALGELWLLAPRDRVIAVLGTEDVSLVGPGSRLAAERPMDLQVDPGLMNSGLGVWMNQAVAERSDAALAIGGNRNSRGIVERLFTPMPAMHSYTCVIDSGPFLRKSRAPKAALPALATVGNYFLNLRYRLLCRRGARPFTMRSIERFAADDPLEDARPDPEVLGFERSARALNHRLFDNPQQRYLVEGCFLGQERVGAVAWRIQPGLEGLPQATIIDVWSWPDQRCAILRRLLGRVVERAGQLRCHAVRMSTPDARLAATLRSIGFANPGADRGVPVGLLSRNQHIASSLARACCAITPLLDDDDGLWAAGRG